MPNFSPLQLPAYGSGPGGKTPALTIDLSSASTYKAIGFSSDWSLAGLPQPLIRVAVHSAAGFGLIHHDQPVPATGKWVLEFGAEQVDYISVARANASTALVSAGT